ncbi:hypothetical protein D3C72_1596610 [compost metagenome]
MHLSKACPGCMSRHDILVIGLPPKHVDPELSLGKCSVLQVNNPFPIKVNLKMRTICYNFYMIFSLTLNKPAHFSKHLSFLKPALYFIE